jgi:hypothetical protein
MAKQAPRVEPADKKAVQEILGRALTDQKFLQALLKSPAKALAGYRLRSQTLAYIKEGVRLKNETDRLKKLLGKVFGDEVKGG